VLKVTFGSFLSLGFAALTVLNVAPVVRAAETPQTPAEMQQVLAAVGSLGEALAKAEPGELDKLFGAESDKAKAEQGSESAMPNAALSGDNKRRMAVVLAGASAGAGIGAATRKGTKAIVAGAVLGGIAGLIYDHMQHDQPKKAEAEKPAEKPAAPATQPQL
jgi:hypothetical protein